MRILITFITALTALAVVWLGAGPTLAHACAGLIGSNGAVNLGRTTTLAAYHDGVEHYVTAFQFQGGGGEFGALIPLPGVPSKVERGGAWTLQRLALETEPVLEAAVLALSSRAAGDAEVLLETRIDALDLTVLKGGGPAVAVWAQEHDFRLSPDAPEVLDFYAERSPIFLAAVFDGDAALARGQQIGDGTPVHLTIPTANPWVPLRILALGKQPEDRVEAQSPSRLGDHGVVNGGPNFPVDVVPGPRGAKANAAVPDHVTGNRNRGNPVGRLDRRVTCECQVGFFLHIRLRRVFQIVPGCRTGRFKTVVAPTGPRAAGGRHGVDAPAIGFHLESTRTNVERRPADVGQRVGITTP